MSLYGFLSLLYLILSAFVEASDELTKSYKHNISLNGTAVRLGKHHFYYIVDGVARLFIDRYTINSYGYGLMSVPYVGRDYINSLKQGPPVPSLWDHHPNEEMLIFVGDSKVFLDKPMKLLAILNPSIAVWRDNLILCWRLDDSKIRIVRLSNHSITDLGASIHSLAGMPVDKIYSDAAYIDIPNAEDPRVYVTGSTLTNQRLFVVFCRRYPRKRPEIQTSYVELFPEKNHLRYDDIVFLDFNHEKPGEDQKNWSPFEYNSKMYFVTSICPHRIIDPVITNPSKGWMGKANTAFLTQANGNDTIWKHGEMRGGTPAVRVAYKNVSYYLSFFHSSNHPPDVGYVLRTYVMGAYIFEVDPPFAMKALSPHPIVHESMYSGRWTDLPQSFYHIDYVVFPTSFILDRDGDTIHLLYGRQDKEGWYAKLSLKKVMGMLQPVESYNLKPQ